MRSITRKPRWWRRKLIQWGRGGTGARVSWLGSPSLGTAPLGAFRYSFELGAAR